MIGEYDIVDSKKSLQDWLTSFLLIRARRALLFSLIRKSRSPFSDRSFLIDNSWFAINIAFPELLVSFGKSGDPSSQSLSRCEIYQGGSKPPSTLQVQGSFSS